MKDGRALRSTDFPPEEPLAPSIRLTAWILHFQLNQVEDGEPRSAKCRPWSGTRSSVLRGSAFSEFLTDSPEIFGTLVKVRPGSEREQNVIFFPCGRVGPSSYRFMQLFQLGNFLWPQRLIRVFEGQQGVTVWHCRHGQTTLNSFENLSCSVFIILFKSYKRK